MAPDLISVQEGGTRRKKKVRRSTDGMGRIKKIKKEGGVGGGLGGGVLILCTPLSHE